MMVTIKLKKSDLPNGFKIIDVRQCPTCGAPIIFAMSDEGFNTITDGEPCCFALVQFIIRGMEEQGMVDGQTTIDVIQAEEV